MKASVELLSGIVRVGVSHDGYGTPFDYSAAWSSSDGHTAILKALVAGNDGKLGPYVRAAMNALKALGFEVVTWERARDMTNPTPHASTVTDPAEHKKHVETAFAVALAGKLEMKLDSVDNVEELTAPNAEVRTYKLINAVVTVSPKA